MAPQVPPVNPNASPKHYLIEEEQSEKKFNQLRRGSSDQVERVAQGAAAAITGAQPLSHRSPHNPLLPPLGRPKAGAAAASPQNRSISSQGFSEGARREELGSRRSYSEPAGK